jgi:hypothetical protein
MPAGSTIEPCPGCKTRLQDLRKVQQGFSTRIVQENNMTEELLRKNAPTDSTWNAESVFANWDAWQAEFETLSAEMSGHEKYVGVLAGSPATLADWLELYTGQRRRLMPLLIYARMATSVDSNDMTAKGKLGLVTGAIGKFSGATAFAEPEMLALGAELVAWSKAEPRLADYGHYFNHLLLKKAHRRSAEVEEILGLLAEPFAGAYQTASELTNTDLRFADAVDNQGERRRRLPDQRQAECAPGPRARLWLCLGVDAISLQHTGGGLPQLHRHFPGESADLASLLGDPAQSAGRRDDSSLRHMGALGPKPTRDHLFPGRRLD